MDGKRFWESLLSLIEHIIILVEIYTSILSFDQPTGVLEMQFEEKKGLSGLREKHEY